MEDNYEKTMELANRLSGCALGDNGASPYFNKTAMQASHTLRIQQQKIIGIMHSVDKFLEGNELGYDEIMRAVIMREKVLHIIESRPDPIHAHVVTDWLGDTNCSHCGAHIDCTEPFCQHCGARLDEPEVKEY